MCSFYTHDMYDYGDYIYFVSRLVDRKYKVKTLGSRIFMVLPGSKLNVKEYDSHRQHPCNSPIVEITIDFTLWLFHYHPQCFNSRSIKLINNYWNLKMLEHNRYKKAFKEGILYMSNLRQLYPKSTFLDDAITSLCEDLDIKPSLLAALIGVTFKVLDSWRILQSSDNYPNKVNRLYDLYIIIGYISQRSNPIPKHLLFNFLHHPIDATGTTVLSYIHDDKPKKPLLMDLLDTVDIAMTEFLKD